MKNKTSASIGLIVLRKGWKGKRFLEFLFGIFARRYFPYAVRGGSIEHALRRMTASSCAAARQVLARGWISGLSRHPVKHLSEIDGQSVPSEAFLTKKSQPVIAPAAPFPLQLGCRNNSPRPTNDNTTRGAATHHAHAPRLWLDTTHHPPPPDESCCNPCSKSHSPTRPSANDSSEPCKQSPTPQLPSHKKPTKIAQNNPTPNAIHNEQQTSSQPPSTEISRINKNQQESTRIGKNRQESARIGLPRTAFTTENAKNAPTTDNNARQPQKTLTQKLCRTPLPPPQDESASPCLANNNRTQRSHKPCIGSHNIAPDNPPCPHLPPRSA